MPTWPVQSKCDSFYGNPRNNNAAWQQANLVSVPTPWKLFFDGKPVSGIRVHTKCAASLARILAAIWKRLGQSQAEIDRVGMSKFSGSYNFRPMTGGTALSMHAYGCAIDFDSQNNSFGDTTPAMDRRVVEEFEKEGWEWGGHWGKPDGMHFQAAWTRTNPPRLGPMTLVSKTTPKQLAAVSKKASLLVRVRTWFASLTTATGATTAGMFTAENLGLVQGWWNIIQTIGIVAICAVTALGAFWFFSNVILKMMADDHDTGRWQPSGAGQPVENADGVVELVQ